MKGGRCKNCDHKAKYHHMLWLAISEIFVEGCNHYSVCRCKEYIDSDKNE